MVRVNPAKVDLDTDSDNNNGYDSPDLSENEEKIEDKDGEIGKIIPVNKNDDDNDGITDYADLECPDNFTLLAIQKSKVLDKSKLKIKIRYPGLKDLPSDDDFNGREITRDYKKYLDYTKVKKGNIRIWKIDEDLPGRLRDDIIDGGNYVSPGEEYDAELLFGDSDTVTLYMEGINPTEGSVLIEMICDYDGIKCGDKVLVRVVDGNIGVNTTNDTTYDIDDEDETIEDQLDGFVFWKSRNEGETVTDMGIVDLFPVRIEAPAEILITEGWKFFLGVSESASFDVYGNWSGADNRIIHLQDKATAENQLSRSREFRLSGDPRYLEDIDDSWDGQQEYLLKSNSEGKCRILLLAQEPGTDNKIELDSATVTIVKPKNLFHAVSARGNNNNPVTYPTEEGRSVSNYNVYPYPTPFDDYGSINDKKDDILLLVHGYNVSEEDAKIFWDEMFKRFYWTGYRGNLVGLAWEGNQVWPVAFGMNMENALQTSWPVADYITDLKLTYPKQKINIVAHSLGNLVTMDTLRLLGARNNKKFVQNVLHVEAAVWQETLDPKKNFVDNGFSYSVDQLQKVSWKHWFRSYQKPVSGNTINAFNPGDKILTFVMREWQVIIADSWINFYEPQRSDNLTQYRTPYLLWHDIPAWPVQMKKDVHLLSKDEINIPMGAYDSVSTVNDKIDGQDFNWSEGYVSGHSSWYVSSYYDMFFWFDEVLCNKIKVISKK